LREGRIKEGLISYNMAFANNPGNVGLLRDFLGQINQKVDAPEFQVPAVQRAFWLLHLTKTNLVDLELAASIFEKYGLDQYLNNLLAPRQERLTPALQKAYLLALFNNGRVAEFDAFWSALKPSSEILKDQEVQLYRAAFAAGWGGADAASEPSLRLEDYLEAGPWQVLANRLYLQVCERRNELDPYLSALRRLQDWRKDRLPEHVRGWRLLTANGRRAEAVTLAEGYAGSPATGLETVQLAQAFQALELRDRALKLLDRFTLEFSFLDGLWVLYANLLIEAGQWDELSKLALTIRLNGKLAERLRAYGYFLEGRVELAQHRPGAAAQSFAKIASCRIDNPDLGLFIAQGLCQLGYAPAARSVLLPLEQAGQHHPAFWEALITIALAVKDESLLLRATTEALARSPASWPARNNYAAALVIHRRSPSESIKETFQLSNQFPKNESIQINHALALIQNHRYPEADRLLAGLAVSALTESERTVYYLAGFETLLAQQRFDLARLFAREIDARHLFPCQQEHLNQLLQRLPPVAGQKPGPVAAAK
jgi:hypothetical protein